MGPLHEDTQSKKEGLKALIKRLHQGEKPEDLKEEFRQVIGDASSAEIPRIEEELVKEGMPREQILKLCDLHLALFKETLQEGGTLAPPGHPIHTLMEEHNALLGFADQLKCATDDLQSASDLRSSTEEIEQLRQIEERLKDSASHYVREENVLFPYLEKHGITQPPAIMWTEHDKIRGIEKGLYDLIARREKMPFDAFRKQLKMAAISLGEILSNHFYKENNILFPTGLKVIAGDEWNEIKGQFDELGYASFTPESAKVSSPVAESRAPARVEEGEMLFETGEFSQEELESMLDSLPVDITFVDKEDKVRYFSQTKDRIFPRTKAIIGREVQQCHPQKSIHVVNQIVDDFKKGRREVAEFWINMEGRLIFIRYFPVRNKKGEYLGVIEVTQDITEVQKIEGEKRLL